MMMNGVVDGSYCRKVEESKSRKVETAKPGCWDDGRRKIERQKMKDERWRIMETGWRVRRNRQLRLIAPAASTLS
jgi:hypothetical protein